MARKHFEIRDQLSLPLEAPLSNARQKDIIKQVQQLLFRQNARTTKRKNRFIRFRGEAQKLKTPYKVTDDVEKPPRTFLKNARYGCFRLTHTDTQATLTWRIGMPPTQFWFMITALWSCFTVGASGLAWLIGIPQALILILMFGGLPFLIMINHHRSYKKFKEEIREALRLGLIED